VERPGIGIVGLGSIAQYHLRAFAALGGATLRSVMSRRRESVEGAVRQFGVERGFLDYDELLADPGTHAVVICTPSVMHFDMARAALEAGKHVLVEKPMAATTNEVRDLNALAAPRKRVLMAAMTARFTPQYLEAYHAIRRGEIGNVVQIVIRWLEAKTIGVNWEKKPVPVDPKTSCVLYHHGSHMIDAALWFADDTVLDLRVAGARRQALVDDLAVLIRTRKGVLITSVHSFNASERIHDVAIVGDRGVIRIEEYCRLTVNGRPVVETAWDEGLEHGVANQAREFVGAIREGREPIACAADIEPGMQALETGYSQLQELGLAAPDAESC